MAQGRQTAYKIWISDLLNGEYHKEAGEWDPNYVLARNKKISRANIIASVIDVFSNEDGGYKNIEIDDGSGKIKVKAWKDDVKIIENIRIGYLVLLIGRVREFDNEIYLTPEIVKTLQNSSWAKLRRLELVKEYGEPLLKQEVKNAENSSESQPVFAEKFTENLRQKILRIVGGEEEMTYDDLINESGLDEEEVKNIVKELIKEGEIYTPRPGFIRAI